MRSAPRRLTPAPPTLSTTHFFSVDVEEYFHVSAFERVVPRTRWPSLPSRVVESTHRLLDLLARHDALGTFFVLGRVAREHPELVREIDRAGHEVASHGHDHFRVTTQSPDEFRHDVRAARAILEDVVGRPVLGYRAPSFSIRPGMEWALEILAEEGHAYDSSLFPIARPDYGYPAAEPRPHRVRTIAGALWEFPPATTVLLGRRLPAAGGGYLRHLPPALTRRALREHEAAGTPAMLYVHPWEVDPEQPRLVAPGLTRVRHYAGLRRMQPRLERLLAEFRFSHVRGWLAAHGDAGARSAHREPAAAPVSIGAP